MPTRPSGHSSSSADAKRSRALRFAATLRRHAAPPATLPHSAPRARRPAARAAQRGARKIGHPRPAKTSRQRGEASTPSHATARAGAGEMNRRGGRGAPRAASADPVVGLAGLWAGRGERPPGTAPVLCICRSFPFWRPTFHCPAGSTSTRDGGGGVALT